MRCARGQSEVAARKALRTGRYFRFDLNLPATTVPWRNIVQLDGTRIYLRSQRHNLGGPQSRPEASRQVQFVIPTSTPNIQKKSLGEKGSPGGKHSSLSIQFA